MDSAIIKLYFLTFKPKKMIQSKTHFMYSPGGEDESSTTSNNNEEKKEDKKDFSEIDLGKSIIAGNKPSDMLFGKNAGMYSVYIATTHPETPFPHPNIDLRFNSLSDFAKAL